MTPRGQRRIIRGINGTLVEGNQQSEEGGNVAARIMLAGHYL